MNDDENEWAVGGVCAPIIGEMCAPIVGGAREMRWVWFVNLARMICSEAHVQTSNCCKNQRCIYRRFNKVL